MNKLIYIASISLVLTACKKENTAPTKKENTAATKTEVKSAEEKPGIALETFAFPAEVQGCSCYFAKNKADFEAQKFIYIDDYGKNAYIKVSGKPVKIPMKEKDLDPSNFNLSVKGKGYKVEITGKKIEEGVETMMFKGEMTVEDENGHKTTTPIYGECGC